MTLTILFSIFENVDVILFQFILSSIANAMEIGTVVDVLGPMLFNRFSVKARVRLPLSVVTLMVSGGWWCGS